MWFSVVAIASLVLGTVTATPTKKDDIDWKYKVGWDGVTLPASAIGEPVFANGTSLEKRTIGGVYICTDINWGGRCGYAVQPLNTCIKLGNDWNLQISSFGPDYCTHCNGYDTHNCNVNGSGDIWSFDYPGDATGGLGTISPWNDKLGSFMCWETYGGCP